MRSIQYILSSSAGSKQCYFSIKSNMKPIKYSLNYKELLAKLGLAWKRFVLELTSLQYPYFCAFALEC